MKPEINKPSDQLKKKAQTWPIWEKEISEFSWEYDKQETCFILEGAVTITNEKGETFDFGSGDYVVFPKGMKCMWKIHSPVRKHYDFG